MERGLVVNGFESSTHTRNFNMVQPVWQEPLSDRLLGVLKVQSDRLDRGYLRQMAATLGVNDLLERAFDEAG